MRRLLLLLVFLPVFATAGTISGHVFLDANGDGQFQAGELPPAGALVSDGVAIIAPAADGAYQLQTPDAPQVVFVVNPSGTWAAAGFYRYLPAGAGQADFPLIRQEQKQPFLFVHGTDLHIYDNSDAPMARYVQAVNDLPGPVAFVVHTGDLAVDTTGVLPTEGERRLKHYQQMVSGLKPPLFHLPGNHEHAGTGNALASPADPDWGKGLYRRLFGPCTYAFNYAGVGFIAMDGTDVSSGKLQYGIPKECLDWLQAYLTHVDMATPLVMMIHEEFFSLGPQKTQVEQMLQGRKVIMALSGHGHSLSRAPFAGGTETEGGAVSYAWHGGPFGPNPMAYHLVRIVGNAFEDIYGDWAERYPVTVTKPPREAILKDQLHLEARFLDLKNEVTTVDVSFAGAKTTVTTLQPLGLGRAFTCDLPLPALTDGVYDLVLTLHGAGDPMVEHQPYVVLAGTEAPFTAAGPARLKLLTYNVNAADLVKVNGQEIGQLPADAKSGQGAEFEIPTTLLKRLNTVEFVSAPLPGGGCDDFWVGNVSISHQGKTVRDPRMTGVAVPKSPQPTSRAMYFDLQP